MIKFLQKLLPKRPESTLGWKQIILINLLAKNRYRLSDLILLLYIAALVRQFFWALDSQLLAWSLTSIISSSIVAAHAILREDSLARRSSPGRFTWVVYALPLLVIFFLRAPFPDYNFDVLNYHLTHMERGLRGWPFIAGDFFPTSVQFNPLPDMIAGISKFLVGYRLGPLINIGAMLWTAVIAERLLREFISNKYFLRLAAVVVISTELVLYLLSTYLVDLLALPLLLEATYLALNFKKIERKSYTLIHIGLFLGIAFALKLTNLAFIIPIAALTFYNAYGQRSLLKPSALLAALLVMAAPAVPFMTYLAVATGSPVFPYYNKLFRSDLWLATNISDPINGPKNLLETILWPLWVYVYPERGSEFSGGGAPYTGRITLGFVISLVGLMSPWVKGSVKQLSAVMLGAAILWSFSTGNLRYGIFLEVLGGVVIISTLASLFKHYSTMMSVNRHKITALAASFVLLIGMQVFNSYRQAATLDQQFYGDKVQPTVFQEPQRYLRDSASFFTDRDAFSFLPAEQQRLFGKVDVWINSYSTTSGLMTSIKPDIPMISVTPFLPEIDLFYPLRTEAGRSKYMKTLSQANGKGLYSITLQNHLKESLNNLQKAGLAATNITNLAMPFYSHENQINVVLIEVKIGSPIE